MPHRIRVVAAMIDRDGKYLITQRRPTATLPLLWEFPGGRVEEGESDEAALARELKEEMEIEVGVADRVVHDHRWVSPLEMDKYEFPAADEKTVARLLDLEH